MGGCGSENRIVLPTRIEFNSIESGDIVWYYSKDWAMRLPRCVGVSGSAPFVTPILSPDPEAGAAHLRIEPAGHQPFGNPGRPGVIVDPSLSPVRAGGILHQPVWLSVGKPPTARFLGQRFLRSCHDSVTMMCSTDVRAFGGL
jgi:hypothetical protein